MSELNENDKIAEPFNIKGAVKYLSELKDIIVELSGKLKRSEKFIPALKKTFLLFTLTAAILFIFAFFIWLVPLFQEIPSGGKMSITNSEEIKKDVSYRRAIAGLERDLRNLSWKYNSYTSGQSYLVINTTDNRFQLFRNKKMIREGFCSSGSYKMLQTEEGKSWIFKTPKGKFTIKDKRINPVWTRPDWAFVEEGLPVPSRNHPSRYEYGVLGDYALGLGDGYLIHGTIYKRFIGMPVTHGCVRLGDEDLEVIFRTLSVGSKVYIF